MTAEAREEREMQELATAVGDALTEVFGGRERAGGVRVVDAQEAVCRVFDRWLDERWDAARTGERRRARKPLEAKLSTTRIEDIKGSA